MSEEGRRDLRYKYVGEKNSIFKDPTQVIQVTGHFWSGGSPLSLKNKALPICVSVRQSGGCGSQEGCKMTQSNLITCCLGSCCPQHRYYKQMKMFVCCTEISMPSIQSSSWGLWGYLTSLVINFMSWAALWGSNRRREASMNYFQYLENIWITY